MCLCTLFCLFGACAHNGGGGFHVVSSPTAGGAHPDILSGLTAASCEPSAVMGKPPQKKKKKKKIQLNYKIKDSNQAFKNQFGSGSNFM